MVLEDIHLVRRQREYLFKLKGVRDPRCLVSKRHHLVVEKMNVKHRFDGSDHPLVCSLFEGLLDPIPDLMPEVDHLVSLTIASAGIDELSCGRKEFVLGLRDPQRLHIDQILLCAWS